MRWVTCQNDILVKKTGSLYRAQEKGPVSDGSTNNSSPTGTGVKAG